MDREALNVTGDCKPLGGAVDVGPIVPIASRQAVPYATVPRFQPVVTLIAQRYPFTLRLTLAALAVALLLAVPAGVRSARMCN